MIRKCANPGCDVEFRFSHQGRLFPFEIRNAEQPCQDVPAAICDKQLGHATVCFWLCEQCCNRFVLQFSTSSGVTLTPARTRQATQRKAKAQANQVPEPESYERRYAS